MKIRIVRSELLDNLDPHGPRAIRSRRDLQMINFLMGNESWILHSLKTHSDLLENGIVEIGSGDGILLNRITQIFPAIQISGYDLIDKKSTVDNRITWHAGDVTKLSPPQKGGALVANLFLHHFNDDQLTWLKSWCDNFQLLCFNEPLRSPMAIKLGKLMTPFVNNVTRHDMRVSIEGGFIEGEISNLLGLSNDVWNGCECSHWRGAVRVLLWRK
jgi:O-methyltransferase domain